MTTRADRFRVLVLVLCGVACAVAVLNVRIALYILGGMLVLSAVAALAAWVAGGEGD